MKKRVFALILSLALLAGLSMSAAGAGGEQADPVVSQSYLEQVWKEEILAYVHEVMEGTMLRQSAEAVKALADRAAQLRLNWEKDRQGARQTLGLITLKQGDGITFKQGCKFTVLSGSLQAEDTLANITAGIPVDSTQTPILPRSQTYMQKSTAGKQLKAESATVELWINGNYVLRVGDGIDYGSMADALNVMGLFRGTGQGYALEDNTTRVQGLVMFLRLMGLEDEALACTDPIPFTDVPEGHWARGYVAYAYKTGLSNGTSSTTFSPDDAVTAQHYLTFLMRALHYAEGVQFTYNTVLRDAVQQGLFSQSEVDLTSQGTLVRYKMVYLSYYALFCLERTEGVLLMDKLVQDGTLTEKTVWEGIARVKSVRLK